MEKETKNLPLVQRDISFEMIEITEENMTDKAKELFNMGYEKANSEWQDKIKNELNELGNMKVGGEVFTTSVNFAKKILEDLLKGN